MTNEEKIELLKAERKVWEDISDIDDGYWEAHKYIETYDSAIEAVIKQIPQKPIHGQNCPCCDKFNFRHHNYCDGCGQAIDWSEE